MLLRPENFAEYASDCHPSSFSRASLREHSATPCGTFDVAYKSNIKNVELLERHAAQPAVVERGSRRLGAAVIALLLLVLALVVLGAVLVVRLLWRALG